MMLFSYLLISNWALPIYRTKKKNRGAQDISHHEFFIFIIILPFVKKIIELTLRDNMVFDHGLFVIIKLIGNKYVLFFLFQAQ